MMEVACRRRPTRIYLVLGYPNVPEASSNSSSSRTVILIIMVCVLGWGVFHALGAYFNFEPNRSNPWRGVMVLGCVAAFLAFWGLMLAHRSRRS
jgi:hypothetical protein